MLASPPFTLSTLHAVSRIIAAPPSFQSEEPIMADENLSPGNIAKALGVSDGKVKKAIKDLGLEPAAKRGVCSFYAPDQVARIKAAVGV